MKTHKNWNVGTSALVLGLSLGLIPLQAGCKPLTPEAKQNILNAEKVACGLANAFLSDPEITALCNFADAETKPILNLVSAQRVALAKSHAAGVTEGSARSGACPPASVIVATDAGLPDASTSSVPITKDAGTTKEGGAKK